MKKITSDLSGMGYDARDALRGWRLVEPREFGRKADAILAEVKAMSVDELPLSIPVELPTLGRGRLLI
jgi:hypothetical protein